MTLRSLKPFIPSGPDFQLALGFFRDLGFSVVWEGGGMAELTLGGVSFLLQDFDDPHVQRNLMMAVSVDDLDAWWSKLLASGVLDRYPGARAKAPELQPWGLREVHLIDPAGVCWHFA